MAITTRDKRASACLVGMPWRGLLPLPDNAIDTGDRLQSAWVYRGIEPTIQSTPANFRGKVGLRPRLAGRVGLDERLSGKVGLRG